MAEPILDLKDFLERVQDDRELLFELLEIFQADFAHKRELIPQLAKENKSQDIRDLTHSMKGAAGNISAKAIFATCLRMEKNADNGDLSTVEKDLVLLDQQFADLRRVVVELKADPKKFFPG